MKKLYALVLTVLLCGMAASAATYERQGEKVAKKSAVLSQMTAEKVESSKIVNGMRKAPAKAPAVDEIVGEYNWTLYMYLNNNSGWMKGTIEIEKSQKSDSIIVSFAGWPVYATYDATIGTISIPSNQFIEYNATNDIDVYFYHNRWNDDGKGNNFLDTPLEITVNGKNLIFDEFDNVVVGKANVGYFLFAGNNEAVKNVPFDMSGTWEEVGVATFSDGWILSGMGMTVAEVEENFAYEVLLERRKEDGLYRLYDPYHEPSSPFVEYDMNLSSTPGYIVLDLSDPEFVTVIPSIYSGMTDVDSEGVQTDYYNSNLEAYYSITGGYDKAEILAAGVLGNTISNYDAETGTVMIYNCCFGDQDSPDTPYTWTDQSGNSLEMTAKIVCDGLKNSGISNVAVDANAPVEYYNLQGVKVANPSNGGVYIRRQGDKATKVLVK